MRRYIPPRVPEKSHLRYFGLLTEREQRESVKRLMASGQGEHYVAALTGLGVDQVRRMAAAP